MALLHQWNKTKRGSLGLILFMQQRPFTVEVAVHDFMKSYDQQS